LRRVQMLRGFAKAAEVGNPHEGFELFKGEDVADHTSRLAPRDALRHGAQ